jgi:hypothetical protein
MTNMSPEQAARRERIVTRVMIVILVVGGWWFFFGPDEQSPSHQSAPEPRSAASYAQEYGGMVGKYEAILGLTDCTALGRMFAAGRDNFNNNAPGGRDLWRGQMEATGDRMDALGCP